MKTLERNKVPFYYALYDRKRPILDDDGIETGEYELAYSNPTKFFANISPAKGEVNTRQFGEDMDYDKVIVFDNMLPPLNEYTLLWIDNIPSFHSDGVPKLNEEGEFLVPHDYVVKAIAESLNSTSVAIRRVNVS